MNDVKAGLDDGELRKRYSLSAKALVILRKRVAEYLKEKQAKAREGSRSISAEQFMADVRADMNDEELMKKYSLTRRELQRLFRKAIQAGHATAMELSQRLCITQSQVAEAFSEVEDAVKEME